MEKSIHFICYKWGELYDSNDVNILFRSVQRNFGREFTFHCASDRFDGMLPEIVRHEISDLKLPGNGKKLYTFSKNAFGTSDGDFIISLDLDIVIVGALDFLMDDPSADFIIAEHRETERKNKCHGAVYRVRSGSKTFIWDEFIADPVEMARKFPGRKQNRFSEQKWLDHNATRLDTRFFSPDKVLIFREDCQAKAPSHVLGLKAARLGLTLARFGVAKLPNRGEAIVSFSGKTKAKDVQFRHHNHLRRAPFVAEHWHL
jgi:hypothetical protein